MKMYATKLTKEFPEATTCEHCGKEKATWGVVPLKEIRRLQSQIKWSKQESTMFLLEEGEHGKPACGQLLCKKCLEERSGQQLP